MVSVQENHFTINTNLVSAPFDGILALDLPVDPGVGGASHPPNTAATQLTEIQKVR